MIGNHPPQGPYGPPAGAPPGQAPYALNRGQSDNYYNGQSPMPPPPQQGEFGHNNQNGYSGGQGDSNHGGAGKKESSGTGKLVAAGLGGAALGALGGAIIAHEMSQSQAHSFPCLLYSANTRALKHHPGISGLTMKLHHNSRRRQ